MKALELFATGTARASDAPRQVRTAARARAAVATGRPLVWHIDPTNMGLLADIVRERSPSGRASRTPGASRTTDSATITAVLRAVDEAPDRTVVADEATLVPTLRRLRELGVALQLSTGRPYVLPPPAVDISTNDLCGLACVMCKNRAPTRDPRTMAPTHVRAIFTEVAAWGVTRIALTGAGEPFRDPEMLAYIAEASALGLRVNVTTNGFPVSKALATELARHTVSVSVSVHGLTPAVHEAIVGVPKSSANALRAVRRLIAARDARPSKLLVNVSTVVQRQNITEVAPLARWAKEVGCNGFNVQPVNLQHGAIEGERISRRDDVQLLSTLWPLRKDAALLRTMSADLAAIGKLHPRFLNVSEERLELFQRYFHSSSREALGVSCRVGETFLAVDHRGAIKPCYRLPWSRGDAREVSLRMVWNSAVYGETRKMITACPLTCMNNCFSRG